MAAQQTPSSVDLGFEDHSDHDLLRKIAMVGYGVGAVMAAATTYLPDPDPSDHTAMLALAALDLVMTLVLAAGRRFPAWVIRLLAITGAIATISALVACILPIGASLVMYCWPAMTAGYWCGRRELFANLAFMAVASAVALALSRSPDITGSTWSTTFMVMVVVALIVNRLVTRVDLLVGRITQAATEDALTGLLNRRAFESILDQEVARAHRAGVPLSVALFDLDHFKAVNDRFGHAAGDEALRRFGALLQAETRSTDVAARTGGEEFTVLLFDTDAEGAERWAEGISALLVAETLDEQIPLSTSVGVAALGDGLQRGDRLVLAADRALYAAKESGRRRVVVAGPEHRPALTIAA